LNIEVITLPVNSSNKEADVMCPAGKVATGGGFQAPDFAVASSPIVTNNKPVGWHVKVAGMVGEPVAYAICVNES